MDDFLSRVKDSLPARHSTVLMASYAGGIGAHHSFGADATADAEVGSLTKGLTGLLYTQALDRGEVSKDTLLGDLLPLGTEGAATVRLSDVAIHRSALPRLPVIKSGRRHWTRTWGMWRHGDNPYGDTVEALFAQARDTPLGKQRFEYSNLGFALLGHALAAAASSDYATVLRERVTKPIGMHGAYIAAAPDDLSGRALTGSSKSGKPQSAWTGAGIAPAGGLRCTAEELEALLAALCQGSAPGIGALDPVADVPGGSRIGAAWVTTSFKERPITWHNGQTGGFASWLGLDREAQTGFALVSATADSVDRPGLYALDALDS